VVRPDVDESVADGETPGAYVLRLSGDKAAAVDVDPGDVVIGADTTVVHRGGIIGKPDDVDHAVGILRRLQGDVHEVLTGWTVRRGSEERFGITESRVRFRPRSEDELRTYVTETRPFDKAGAYALQADDGWLVESVEGSRSNVMGLPVADVVEALRAFGVERSAP
jgi:septum formation protein